MPWKACKPMDERLKFIARLLDGEPMAVLCREFGISRKTGYKILTRYNEIGLEGLTDRSRRPYRHANQLPTQIETLIVRLKQDKPSWVAPKISLRDGPARVKGAQEASCDHRRLACFFAEILATDARRIYLSCGSARTDRHRDDSETSAELLKRPRPGSSFFPGGRRVRSFGVADEPI
jgi:transposase